MCWFQVVKATATSSDLAAFVDTSEGSAYEWGKYHSRLGRYVDVATSGTVGAPLGPSLGPRYRSRIGVPLGFRLGPTYRSRLGATLGFRLSEVPKPGTAVRRPLGPILDAPPPGSEARNASSEANIVLMVGNPVGNSCNHEGMPNEYLNSEKMSGHPHPPATM
jgi:hypothetical protein